MSLVKGEFQLSKFKLRNPSYVSFTRAFFFVEYEPYK